MELHKNRLPKVQLVRPCNLKEREEQPVRHCKLKEQPCKWKEELVKLHREQELMELNKKKEQQERACK